MTWYILDGVVHETNGSVPEGSIEVPRAPVAYEFWNGSQWQVDGRQWADKSAGNEHIQEARALKYAEALMIRAGIEVGAGMLYQEASQKGLSLDDLVTDVLEKRERFIAAELLRQQRQGEV